MLVFGGDPKKKESVDSELARGRVSKFYWSVALGSRVGVLVSGGESKKEGVRGFGACTWSCQ